MAEERDDEQTNETEGTSSQQPRGPANQQQPIAGQQGQQSEFGQRQSEQAGGAGVAADLDWRPGRHRPDPVQRQRRHHNRRARLRPKRPDQPRRPDEQSGQGFVGSQGTGSDEYLREEISSGTIDRSDFANQGQGAKEGPTRTWKPASGRKAESDIEGGDNA